MNRDAEPTVDALPDYFAYCDEGCDLFPSCLNCPLPRCRYDPQPGGRRASTGLRDAQIITAWKETEKSVAELAGTFGVSKRTVQRILRRLRDEQAHPSPDWEHSPGPAPADSVHGPGAAQGVPDEPQLLRRAAVAVRCPPP